FVTFLDSTHQALGDASCCSRSFFCYLNYPYKNNDHLQMNKRALLFRKISLPFKSSLFWSCSFCSCFSFILHCLHSSANLFPLSDFLQNALRLFYQPRWLLTVENIGASQI